MPKLSVTIITKNEARNIDAALQSVSWADELIVVDAESTDGTPDLARKYTDRVVVRPWAGFIDQKNYAASLASHDWILSLDADERVTPALTSELQATLAHDPSYPAYQAPRVSQYLGRWIRTTDWYPNPQRRLYDRRRARWAGAHVHESLSVDGTVGRLQGELLHLPYHSVAEHLDTINRYTSLAAQQMRESGKRAGTVDLVLHPPLAFLRNYIARGGFRDGSAGFIISALNAYYVFLKFAKLWELDHVDRRS